MRTKVCCAALFILSILTSGVAAQECNPPPIVANVGAANIFSPEQETILGDLTLESMSGDVRLVRDDELIKYVNAIGERLVRHLPPTGLTFKFHIIDLPEANAFNIPGGHVFLSRKLIAFSATEDELAGVMAHELGHAAVHHGAVDITEAFKRVLNVTALGDRKDVTDKYNRLIENARTKSGGRRRGHEDAQQLEADRIGLFAMVAAGYDPNAFTSFFDRLTESEGKTGNWFSNLFGSVRPEQKRLREMIKLTSQLPANCRDRKASGTDAFSKWQAEVVLARPQGRKETLPGLLWKKELAPKLTSDVRHLAFSADGKYILAQDDFSVTVLSREPFSVLFQISAEDAEPASFTSDGKEVVFMTSSLRFERWSVELKKPLAVRELVLRRNCWDSKLSPNGNYLACIDTEINLAIIETATGRRVFEAKKFYELTGFEFFIWLVRTGGNSDETGLFRIEFSPDSRHVVFSRSDKFRYRFMIDMMTVDSSENTATAVDLATLKTVDVGKDVKKLAARPYTFVENDKIIGLADADLEAGGVFAFPSGKRLRKFQFGGKEFKRTENPDFLVIKPITNASMGIFDLKKGIIAAGFNKADAAIWNDLLVFESTSGKLILQKITYNVAEKLFDGKEVASVDVPVGSIGSLRAAGIADDFSWLAMSAKSRGGMWNLATGERKLFMRGFESALVSSEGAAVGAFPKLGDTPHSLVLMNSQNGQTQVIRDLSQTESRQYGRFILQRSSIRTTKEKNPKASAEKDGASARDGSSSETDLSREVKFELVDFIVKKTIWTREFPKEAPRYSFDEYSGRLMFFWTLASEGGKAMLAQNPALKAKAESLGDKDNDYLVEVVDAFAQKTVGMVLLETGKGSFWVRSGLSERDWLMLYDSTDRVLVYSLGAGELKHRFFGRNAALNPTKNLIAVENFPGDLAIYDLDSGDIRSTVKLSGTAAFVRFNLDGNKLFVLSDTQNAYAFDMTALVAGKP